MISFHAGTLKDFPDLNSPDRHIFDLQAPKAPEQAMRQFLRAFPIKVMLPSGIAPMLMKKVYEDLDLSMVGHFKSLLESEGIRCEIRNEGGVSLAGEVPFTQVYPELWVLSNADLAPGKKIIDDYKNAEVNAPPRPDWLCPKCGETNEGNFSECWNCSSPVPPAK